jgi:hypothetical protein
MTTEIEIPKSYFDAKKAGWIETNTSLCRGYVSRKMNTDNAPIHAAGGIRRGEYYVLLPSWQTSQFCIRQYLKPPQNSNVVQKSNS